MKSVIVTGATSFIGISLIRNLVAQGKEVYAIIRPNSARKKYLPISDKLIIIESELSEIDNLILPVDSCDTLFHIAWSSDFPNPRFNIEGQMQNVIFAEKAVLLANRYKCNTFLCVGSQAECGQVNGCITPDTIGNPQTAYAMAKLVTYARVQSLCEKYGMKLCWPRLLSAYGPFDRPHTLVMTCITACLENHKIELTSGRQIWDYIYVDDVAEAFCCIAEKGKHAKKYPVGSGIARSLRSYIEEIAEITNNYSIIDGLGKRSYAENQVMNLLADICELRSDTGFTCKTGFNIGVQSTIESMQQFGV